MQRPGFRGSALGFRGIALGSQADRARIAHLICLCNNMRRFCEFGNNHRQKKCNHSIDTVAMSGDPALRDFFVNYEHMAIPRRFSKEYVANL
jgi:hypothetical protein